MRDVAAWFWCGLIDALENRERYFWFWDSLFQVNLVLALSLVSLISCITGKVLRKHPIK